MRVSTFWNLSGSDRRVLLEAALLVPLARLGLGVLPHRRVERILARVAGRRVRPPRRDHAPAPDRIAWAVTRVSAYMPGATCLAEALAALALCARHGHPAELRIGVASRDGGGVAGHAWVESRGRVVVGGGAGRCYTPLTAVAPVGARHGGNG